MKSQTKIIFQKTGAYEVPSDHDPKFLVMDGQVGSVTNWFCKNYTIKGTGRKGKEFRQYDIKGLANARKAFREAFEAN